MLQLLLGRSGSGKSDRLFARLETLAQNDDTRAFLLVPEQYSFAAERELLTRLGAQRANRVAVVSFSRLADTVFREVGGMAREPLDDGMRALLMSRALSEVAAMAADLGEPLLGADPRAVTDAAYVEQLLDLWEEMRVCGVVHEALARAGEALAATGSVMAQGLQQKVTDFDRVFAAYRGLVADAGLEDTDKLSRLAERLPECRLFDGAAVLVDGFKGFTAQELAVLARLIGRAGELTVALCTDTAGRHNHAADASREGSLFSPVTDTVRRLQEMAAANGQAWEITLLEENFRHQDGGLRALEAGLYAPAPAAYDAPTDAVTVTPCTDVYEECACVARRVRRLLREEGMRCRDITLVARDMTAYAGLLEDALEAQGIEYYTDARRALLDEPLLVYIRAALRVAVGGFHTEELLRLLKTDMSPLDPVAIAGLENYVYMWGIDGAGWTQEWAENPAGLGTPVTPATAHTLAQLNARRAQLIAPLQELRDALRGGANGRGFALALYRYLTADGELSARLARRVALLEEMAEPLLADHAARVWDEVMALLDRFAAVLGDYRMSAARLEELFTMLAQMVDLGHIPQALDAVTIGGADRIRYHRPRVVFVLGANEGVFPAYPDEGGLFSEEERQLLEEVQVSLSDGWLTRCIEERYFAYMALSAPRERLFVSYHTAGESVASPVVGMIEKILPQHRREEATAADGRDAESADEVFSALARQYTAATPATESMRQVLAGDPVFAGRLAAVERALGHGAFRLEETAVAETLFGRDMILSASRTKTFYNCRFAYFCKYGLRLQPRRVAQVDAGSFGTVVHYVMETLLPEYSRPDGLIARLKAEDAARAGLEKDALAAAENATQAMLLKTLSGAVHDAVMAYAAREMGGVDNKPGRFLYMLELAERSAYNMLWHTVMELRQSAFEPARFELEICPTDAADTPAGELPSLKLGFSRGSVRMSGKVDRVDLFVRFDGKAFVRVVDYKTGSDTFALSDLSYGLNMQMLLYLYTVCDYPERLLPTAEQLTPAGVLYHPLSDLAVSRDAGDKAQKKRLASMCMDGLVLDDASVVQAMEQNAEGLFVPAKIDKGGQATGNVATAAHFALLRGVVEQMLVNMAESLLDGDITALPTKRGDRAQCQWCDYRSICARDEDAPVVEIVTQPTKQVLQALEDTAKGGAADE